MPELPDVERARRSLERWLVGARVARARSSDRRLLHPHPPAKLARALAGRTVRSVSRRGKWLRIELEDGGLLFSHLGMTGRWLQRDPEAPAERAERARLDVVGPGGTPSSVRYLDSRRFGRLVIAREDIAEWRALGPDPLAAGIDPAALAGLLSRTRRPIKVALLDQSVLAGVGNILATEALWKARLDPRSPSDALDRRDVAAVVRGLRRAIEEELGEMTAPKRRGSAFSVYGRTGRACPRCGHAIAFLVLGGRGTAYCPGCQVRRGPTGRRRHTAKRGG